MQQTLHLSAAAGVAADGDVLRIAAEGGNVLVNPLHCRHQVGNTGVSGVLEFLAVVLQVHMRQNVQPVVDGDKDDVSVVRQVEAVEGDLLKGIAAEEAAAVNPDKHSLLLPVQRFGGPDVQILAILAFQLQHMQAPVVGEGVRRQNLLGNGAVTVSILDALPAGNFLRHVEAFGVGIFHTHEDVDIAVGHTPQLTLLGLYDRSGRFKNIGIHNGRPFYFMVSFPGCGCGPSALLPFSCVFPG